MRPHLTWLRQLAPVRRARYRLICFPHAGGNCAFFRDWKSQLPSDVELFGVQYPGRMDRINDAWADSVCGMASDIATEILSLEPVPLILFGHSLGAAVSYECGLALESSCPTIRQIVIASGRPAPSVDRGGSLHLTTEDRLCAHIAQLGGTPPEALEIPELRSLVLPTLRQDYRLSETYHPSLHQQLAAPVLACMSDQDPEVSLEEIDAWRCATAGHFDIQLFRGHHFYLVDQMRPLMIRIFEFAKDHLEAYN